MSFTYRYWLGIFCAYTLSLLAWGQSNPLSTHQDALTNDFRLSLSKVVVGPMKGNLTTFNQLISACNADFTAAHAKINREWYARTAAPTPEDIAAQQRKIIPAVESVKIKYLALFSQQLFSDKQRQNAEEDQLVAFTLSGVKPTVPQKAKTRRMAQEIMTQIVTPPEYEALFQSRLAALRERVTQELLPQATATAPIPSAATTAPATGTAATNTTPKADPGSVVPDDAPIKYYDKRSRASNAGKVTVSPARLSELEPMLAPPPPTLFSDHTYTILMETITEHMRVCDARAAVVVELNPLLVASYSDDLDAVVILQFPQWLVKTHKLEVGSRLLAVNSFSRVIVGTDIVRGPKALNPWKNVFPIIADFVCDDPAQVSQAKAAIEETEWQHCLSLGQDYRQKYPTRIRNGSPLLVEVPGK